MKVLIVLAVAVAVSNAAFIGQLTSQTRPLVDQAISQIQNGIRLRNARSGSEAGAVLQGRLVNAMRNNLDEVIGQIEVSTGIVEGAVQTFTAQFGQAIQQINSAVLSGTSADSAAQSFRATFQEIMGTLNSHLMSGAAKESTTSTATDVSALVNASPMVQNLHRLVASLNMQDTVRVAIRHVFGDEFGEQLIGAMSQNPRGFFGDLWGSITDVAGNVWDGITDAAEWVWDGVTDITTHLTDAIINFATTAWNSAAEKFEIIKHIAQTFAEHGLSVALQLGQQAAQQLLDQIAPYIGDLGSLASTVISTLIASHTGLVIPPSVIEAIGSGVISIGGHIIGSLGRV
ncbi:hypothetical protein BV898_13029 [Hypsibius exemplaris]|uniref:Uncharacterized protein n=1 Tax=Hypsibius exemplaris TaxID=2072580 RepID=A0A1W0WC09_HYPEX|nr:hypothetical protein BV898_13029 [Hypsibius exemplaris]